MPPRTQFSPELLRPRLPSEKPARRPSDSLIRAAVSVLVNGSRTPHPGAEAVCRALFERDEAALTLTRAATNPATTGTAGWASQLATTSVADFVQSMGSRSGGAALLAQGMQLDFGSSAAILVPGIVSTAAPVSFVAEGAAIPVQQLTIGGPTLTPKKLAVIVTATRELLQHGASTTETLIGAALRESAALALDSALFDAAAADAARPAGLRNGISATTATAGGGTAALLGDLTLLASAVAGVAGNGGITFVMSPARAAAASMMVSGELNYEIIASSGVAADEVIAIAPDGLVSAIDPVPSLETSKVATLHMDTSPVAIGSTGPVVAAPSRETFQTDTVALKMRLSVSWALRSSAALAWLENASW